MIEKINKNGFHYEMKKKSRKFTNLILMKMMIKLSFDHKVTSSPWLLLLCTGFVHQVERGPVQECSF